MGDGDSPNWGNIFRLTAAAVAGGALAAYVAHKYNEAQGEAQHSVESRQHAVESRQHAIESRQHAVESKKHSIESRSVGNVREKHEAAAPYYFFLSSATDSGKTSSDPLSLQFSDILDPSLGGRLKSSLQLNYILDYNWLMSQYRSAGQYGTPITLIYGQRSIGDKTSPSPFDDFVTSVQITPQSSRGIHHTKMCVLEYEDGSVRVCVHTGNLNKFDWDNCVQGVWLSPLCPALPVTANSKAGESPTNFRGDLIEYLSAYSPVLQPWIGKLRGIDFSNINVFFVASPGSCEGLNSAQWGLAKLSGLLNQSKSESELSSTSWQIIAQCSNIGSLGSTSASWFKGELRQAMSQGLGVWNAPSIRVVYPSSKHVENSNYGGYCLTYLENTHDKQVWLKDYLNGWKCDKRQRTKIMPHIKTYTCVSQDNSELAWFLLTSANLSKPAWCCKTETGDFMPSFEAGVLFLPKFVIRTSAFPIKEESYHGFGYAPVFPMPYDLPLPEYTSRDKPFFRKYKADNSDADSSDAGSSVNVIRAKSYL